MSIKINGMNIRSTRMSIMGSPVPTPVAQTDWYSIVTSDAGNNSGAYGEVTAYDSQGFLYMAGANDYDGLPLLIKFNQAGTVLWQKQYAGSTANNNYQMTGAIVIDSSDNVYVAINDQYYSGSTGHFTLLKADGITGDVVWQTQISADGVGTTISDIIIDASNNIYAVGYTHDSTGLVMLKFNSSGTLQWQKKIVAGLNPPNRSVGITLDSSGNIYITGTLFDAQAGFVAKLDSSGNFIWQNTLNVIGSPPAYSYAKITDHVLDSSGNLYFIGSANTASSSSTNIIFGKVSSSGSLSFSYAIADTRAPESQFSGYGGGIAIDASNNIYIVGNMCSDIQDPYNSGSFRLNTYSAKFNSSGTMIWQKKFGVAAGNIQTIVLFEDGPACIDLYGTKLAITGETPWPYGSNFNDAGFMLQIPQDGSLSGTFDLYTLYDPTTTTQTASNLEFVQSNLTIENYTATSSTGTLVSSNSTYFTQLTTMIPVITPVANFMVSSTSGALPLDVTFTDTSTNSPTSWLWDFGDGNTSTDQNPIYQYTTVGNYTVSLTVSNGAGSNAVAPSGNAVTVAPPVIPSSSFTVNRVSDTSVTFTNTTSSTYDTSVWYVTPQGYSTQMYYTQNLTLPITVSDVIYNVTLESSSSILTDLGYLNTITTTSVVRKLEARQVIEGLTSPSYVSTPWIEVTWNDPNDHSLGSPTGEILLQQMVNLFNGYGTATHSYSYQEPDGSTSSVTTVWTEFLNGSIPFSPTSGAPAGSSVCANHLNTTTTNSITGITYYSNIFWDTGLVNQVSQPRDEARQSFYITAPYTTTNTIPADPLTNDPATISATGFYGGPIGSIFLNNNLVGDIIDTAVNSDTLTQTQVEDSLNSVYASSYVDNGALDSSWKSPGDSAVKAAIDAAAVYNLDGSLDILVTVTNLITNDPLTGYQWVDALMSVANSVVSVLNNQAAVDALPEPLHTEIVTILETHTPAEIVSSITDLANTWSAYIKVLVPAP